MKNYSVKYGGVLWLMAAVWSSCSGPSTPSSRTLFSLVENSGINFINKVENDKDFNIFSYRNFYNGGGVAIGDINNDGLADVFFTSNKGQNTLYLNKGNWQFQDISVASGITGKNQWSTGVVMVDINGDGWLDIYVCNAGYINGEIPESKLYINNKNLSFTESARQYGLTNTGGYATHAAFFDYDLDGDLDVFIINNSFIPVNTLNYANKRELRAADWPVADYLKGGGDRFLRNDNGRFTDISKEAGIHGSLISFGLGVTVGDVNNDHYPDVYVSNDFFERDYLYINQRDGTFSDELEKWVSHLSHASMGADLADINNDGFPDLFVTEMLPEDEVRLKTTTSFENIDVQRFKESSGFYHQFMQNTLQVNDKHGKFIETAFYSGVAATDWSWGGLLFDADNDGLNDIYVCNGIYHDVTNQDFIDFFANEVMQKMVMTGKKEQIDAIINKMPSTPVLNKAFHNSGQLRFADSGLAWGFTKPSFSNGAAYGDLDNDGDLDLVINNLNQPSFVYRNNSREINQHNYIGFVLQGKNQNSFAVGASVRIYQGSQVITRELIPSRGFQSSVDYKIIAGLGRAGVDSAIITWPDHSQTVLVNPAINKVHQLKQEDARGQWRPQRMESSAPMMDSVRQNFEKHAEDDFIDSYYDKNIPIIVSKEGPHVAHGDVNGDGLEDLFIGGARKQSGQLYLQTSGTFVKKTQAAFSRFAEYEDAATLFFDCDKDGDLDLFVGSAGNNRDSGSKEFNNRLFKNDGKGNFEWDSIALPANGVNNGVALNYDYDNDGDEDLFLASRSIPLDYGPSPKSFLLQNDGKGRFTDVTNSIAPELLNAGMVTGAAWVNINGDSRKELVIVSEWKAPLALAYDGQSFKAVSMGLEDLNGWWQSIAAADLDNDGDQDLVIGNIGENFYLQVSQAKPAKIWINDFDKNGATEKIITRMVNGKDVPVFLKRDITEQVVSLKKQNLKHAEYAQKTIQQLFDPVLIETSKTLQFNFAASIIALNDGNGKFSVRQLPLGLQLSSVNAIHCTDINGDGLMDIVAGGNRYDLLPQFCRLDASEGHVLINKGKADFENLPSSVSGFRAVGQARDIAEILIKRKPHLLVLLNNQYPILFRLAEKRVKTQ